MTQTPEQKLKAVLSSLQGSAVAVSGGVDSMTLAVIANRLLGRNHVTMMHAVSPAVPAEASERVRHFAGIEGWDLRILDAGEFADDNYIANPVNRCFFCKANLYRAIASISDRRILSGANTDDLGEYRPGLDAARNHGVRHPYLEAGIDKKDVRALARALGLADLAELPASPCLSSRVETAIAINPKTLTVIHAIERFVDAELAPKTVRCRVRKSGIVIELDEQALIELTSDSQLAFVGSIAALLPAALAHQPITLAPYRNGSAFIGARP
jgi:uncharacterized protein